MTTYIALLRGINVSGQKKVPMADLKALFEQQHCTAVQTYIQSGNVVFCSAEKKETLLVKTLENAIREKFGFEVPLILRTAAEMQQAVATNPYLDKKGTQIEKLHITFLERAPEPENLQKAAAFPSGTDSFICREREIYLHCPGGYGNSKLSNTFFEQKLKIRATTRNWKTVQVLAEMGQRMGNAK